VLTAVLLGWMGAGVEMSLMIPATRPAIQDFVGLHSARIEVTADQWLSWFVAAFLLGAAVGGLVLGWLGDRAGRVRAMAVSILCYSLITGLGYFATSPEQLLVLRFLACVGIGGMWPTGVALVNEAWPGLSRPVVAGVIGASANVGFLVLGILMLSHPVTRTSWRWVMLLGATPALLGVLVWFFLSESPEWLKQRAQDQAQTGAGAAAPTPLRDVFRPPLRRLTLLGIFLGTIPLLGGWASGQRLIPWAGQVAENTGLADLKALTQVVWAGGAVLGSLLGGWAANRLGRRLSYALISAGSLGLSVGLFLGLTPAHPAFPWMAFALGFVSTMFFGWLPYFLPELFPTRVRTTGMGVSFNFGRILSAGALLSSTALSSWFHGDIAKMGAVTSLIYAGGLVLVPFIPTGSEERGSRVTPEDTATKAAARSGCD
jgi:MFS family permease